MKLANAMKRFLWLSILLLTACETGIVDPVVPSPTVAVETYQVGAPITFDIDEMVYVCNFYNDEIPYAIMQVTETGERQVALRHSCIGFVAHGVNEYCEDGEIRTEDVEVGNCSDDVSCGDVAIKKTYTWDQQEYVKVTETCGSERIQREVKQQVPEGEYKIVVELQMEAGEIVTKVIKEFVIIE